jgi:para-nitrobenzyl esterase
MVAACRSRVVWLFYLALVGTIFAVQSIAAENAAPIHTTSGFVVGLPADPGGVRAYLGIPYAEPPVGEHRFLPPIPVKESTRTLHAVEFGPPSAQRDENEDVHEFGEFLNENSLTLNVWTPGVAGARPVMVWIHGGGNTQGSSREAAYNGARIAARGQVIVVSLNYRLGIFGFVDMSVLGGPRYRKSANNGLLDQLLALRWIKQNIAAFGGNPGNVTVFGNSAGGADISALLAVHSPEQYFHRAIIQSGFANTTKSKEVAQRLSSAMLGRSHIRSMRELLAKSPKELLAAQAAALKEMSELESDLSFQPTVDGSLVREFPLDALRHGNARNVDLILGTTLNELRLYLKYNPELRNAQLTDIPGVRDLPENKQRELWDEYHASREHMTEGQVVLDIGGDYWFRAGAIRMAEAQLVYNKNVYMYLFAWHAVDPELGAPHAIELPFVFGNESGHSPLLGDLDDPATGSAVRALTAKVQEYWSSFARTGQPVAKGDVDWPRYDGESRRTIVFDRTVKVLSDPYAKERGLFDGVELNRRIR